MSDLAQFPSQGDLIKFIYNATGIIPSKNKKNFIIDIDMDDKSLHKSLDRLAKEEGDFLKNFEQHISEFRSAIHSLFTNAMYSGTLYDPLLELFQIYTQTVLTNQTYLGKKESLFFLISTVFLRSSTISIFQYQQCYSVFLDASVSPSKKFWYLEYGDTTPLAYIIHWIYNCENKSQEGFHNTFCEKRGGNIDQIDKDLANVNNWVSGAVKLPTFSSILDVFDRGFQFHNIDDDRKQKYRFFLLIARFVTYCLKSLYENYKEEDVSNILKKLRDYLTLINKDFEQFYSINEVKRDSKLTGIEKDIVESWQQMQIINFFLDKSKETERKIAHNLSKIQKKYIEESSKNSHMYTKSLEKVYQEELERWYSTAPNKFVIRSFQDTLTPFNDESYRKNIENCGYGYYVMKEKYDHQKWLNEYHDVGNDIVFPWLKYWIDGMKLFYSRDFESSLTRMREAFNTIRYSAGNRQIKFIEDYMLVALAQPNKNGNVQGWKDFKIAFKWGVFMNHFDAFPEFYSDKNNKELKTMFEEKKKDFIAFPSNSMDTKILAKLLFHWKYDT
ncbi:hypothetical protein [Psychrobacter sp. SZ93C1]|uniref:hypothetical protein n=1 Tax=Psychrobacter sp. SZ93C1 TaxID=2792058 RepID=UPI0018CEEA38|nr:hypothetical protein [Psychrobacter sp. SZ93C1]MBH0063652.1 hypothetical protein [Psychrobacter sp. SZ93C1]